MNKGVIGLGMWCVDTTYKINELPERGKLEPILDSFQCVGGGPSNVLTDLSSLGFNYPMIAMGSIGLDGNASIIKDHLKKNNIQINYLISSKTVPTSQTVCMSEKKNERTFLYYPGANNLLDTKHFKIDDLKSKPKILYIGYLTLLGKLDRFNYNKTRLNIVLEKAKKKNLITVLDLVSNKTSHFQKIVYSALPFTDYLLLNEIEAQLLFKKSIKKNDNYLNIKLILQLTKKIFKKGLLKGLIIHNSKESVCVLKDQTHNIKSKIIPQQKIKNAVGAGDAFCAAFIYGIHENWNIEKILKKAHAAGTAMMKIDASSGYLPDIKKL
jgi:sugar/nucleoside kinase (ribokinase family)|tara:strand:- start:157 stop:1131 length:975 start_codon:yes stop_codon:yes gene_type:complete